MGVDTLQFADGRLIRPMELLDTETDTATPAHRRRTRRHAAIVEHVLENGDTSAAELASLFGVSLMTIHRDLDALAQQGILRRYHGGVTAQRTSVFEPDAGYRLQLGTAAKRAIAEKALGLVDGGMSLMLDDSTTALALARLLVGGPQVTVATNFLETMAVLADAGNVRLIGLGGDYSPTHRSFLGSGCLEAVRSLRVDLLLCSTSAMDADTAYHQEQAIVTVKRAMMESAARRVLLMDHSKVGRSALHRVSALSEWDYLIVDARTPSTAIAELRDRDVTVEVAGPVGIQAAQ
jgi:DeoR/GlpR family transcriptional regulator of sugar metabolism